MPNLEFLPFLFPEIWRHKFLDFQEGTHHCDLTFTTWKIDQILRKIKFYVWKHFSCPKITPTLIIWYFPLNQILRRVTLRTSDCTCLTTKLLMILLSIKIIFYLPSSDDVFPLNQILQHVRLRSSHCTCRERKGKSICTWKASSSLPVRWFKLNMSN